MSNYRQLQELVRKERPIHKDAPPLNAKSAVLEAWLLQKGLLDADMPAEEDSAHAALVDYVSNIAGISVEGLLRDIYSLPDGTVEDLVDSIVNSDHVELRKLCSDGYPLCESDVFWHRLFRATFPDLHAEFKSVLRTERFNRFYKSVVPTLEDIEASEEFFGVRELEEGAGDDPEESLVAAHEGILSFWRLLYADTNVVTSIPNLLKLVDAMINNQKIWGKGNKSFLAIKGSSEPTEMLFRRLSNFRFFSFFFFSSIGKKYARALIVVDSDVWTMLHGTNIQKAATDDRLGPVVFEKLMQTPESLQVYLENDGKALAATLAQMGDRGVQRLRNALMTGLNNTKNSDIALVRRIAEIDTEDAKKIIQMHNDIIASEDVMNEIGFALIIKNDFVALRTFLSNPICDKLSENRSKGKRMLLQALGASLKANQYDFISKRLHLESLRVLIEDGRIDPGFSNHIVFRSLASNKRNLDSQTLEILLLYPAIDFQNTSNYASFRDCGKHSRLDLIKIYEKDPRINVGARQNQVLRYAAIYLDVEMMRHFLSRPAYDPSDKANYAIRTAYQSRSGNLSAAKEIVQMLLGDQRVSSTLSAHDMETYADFVS